MPAEFAIVNKSSKISDDVIAFAAKAVDAQVRDCAAIYGIDPRPVAFYASEENLPREQVWILAIVNSMDEAPDALGYHDDQLGVIFMRVLVQDPEATGVTISHEILEALLDSTCDQWRDMGGGRQTAFEICDAVEADTYDIEVEILGETRQVKVSNYVLPRWFDPAASGGFDRMGKLSAPFGMTDGGYMIVRDALGNTSDVFAGDDAAKARVAFKRSNPNTRLARRLSAKR